MKVAGRSVLLVVLPATVDNTVDMDLTTVHNNLERSQSLSINKV